MLADRHVAKLKRLVAPVGAWLDPILEMRLRMAASEIEARQYARGWSEGSRQAFDSASTAMEIAARQPVQAESALTTLQSCLDYIRLSVTRSCSGEPLDADIAAAFTTATAAIRTLSPALSLPPFHQAIVPREFPEASLESHG